MPDCLPIARWGGGPCETWWRGIRRGLRGSRANPQSAESVYPSTTLRVVPLPAASRQGGKDFLQLEGVLGRRSRRRIVENAPGRAGFRLKPPGKGFQPAVVIARAVDGGRAVQPVVAQPPPAAGLGRRRHLRGIGR